MIVRFCSWFERAFGSTSCFAICVVLLVLWVGAIPILGLGHWNSTLGLGGNTVESTVELFLEIAILTVAHRVDGQHDKQLARLEELELRILEKLGERP